MGPDLGDMSKSSGLYNVFLGSGELHQPPGPAVFMQVQSHRSHAEVQETLQGREHHLPHPILRYHPEQDSQTHPLPRRGRWVFSRLTHKGHFKVSVEFVFGHIYFFTETNFFPQQLQGFQRCWQSPRTWPPRSRSTMEILPATSCGACPGWLPISESQASRSPGPRSPRKAGKTACPTASSRSPRSFLR